jgi:hypothetical protein
MRKTLLASFITSLTLGSSLSVHAQNFDTLVKDSSVKVNFRYRAESADIDDTANTDSALANTLKSRITFQSGAVSGLSLLVEADNVLHLTDEFNSSKNNETQYDEIKDPESSQINQAYIQFKNDQNIVTLGNQRINLDNQRHIGSVAFRQDEQTFDAISIKNTTLDKATVFASFANNVNTITNDNAELEVSILNVKYAVTPDLSAGSFYYGIESENGDTLNTVGVRATGSASSIAYEAELASQSESIADTRAQYLNLSASAQMKNVTAKLGLEIFGSDKGDAAFTTPLATNHKFFGWSDAYLGGAGNNGIQDIQLSAATQLSGVNVIAQLHKFDAVEGNNDLGTEMGIHVNKTFAHYGAGIKAAYLSDSDISDDVSKLWLTVTANF